jgi:hypothetical protein
MCRNWCVLLITDARQTTQLIEKSRLAGRTIAVPDLKMGAGFFGNPQRLF